MSVDGASDRDLQSPGSVLFGVDRLTREPTLLGAVKRVGLVTNDAARLASDTTRPARLALLRALRTHGIELVRLFGPEHGLSGTAADGAAVEDHVDAYTGLPTVSLYGERMRPAPEHLRDLDALIFDIPDVGARFYTYTWTLYHLLAESDASGIPLIVLDRPNPLSGLLTLAEGPLLDLTFRSFVGEDVIPIRHQLTLGELARLWQFERFTRAPLHVIPCHGWTREMLWPDTGLPWVPTSPAMPSFDSVALYPGLCLFEATNLSVGRGTATPFQMIGAPWLDAQRVLDDVQHATSASLSTCDFIPAIAPYAGQRCVGVRLERHPSTAGVVSDGLHLLSSILRTHGADFAWSSYPTAANPSGAGHFERLIGRTGIREALERATDAPAASTIAEWTSVDEWADRVHRSGAVLYTTP